LRYLEYYEFRLVREALIEREVLLRAAPHIIWPMRFVLPHSPEQRPAWMVRAGLFLYDHLGGRKLLPPSRKIDLRTAPEGRSIKKDFPIAFEYSDCWVDDARLVVLNALDAQTRGATVLTRTAATSARREGNLWTVEMRSKEGVTSTVRARALVNSAGPWVEDVIGRVAGRNSSYKVRLVKGSHIVVPKFWEGPQAYLFQNDDKRVIFVNPYEGDLTLIGTTDIPYKGDPSKVSIDQDEIDYLLKVVNRYAATPIQASDIVHAFSGVRPLYDNDADANASAVTRDYVFEVDSPGDGQPPLLSVFGGKITTFRKLAEHALDKLTGTFPQAGKPWTSAASLPGGDIPNADFDGFLRKLSAEFAWLPVDLATHYGRLYGTRARDLLAGATGVADLGRHFGNLLYQREAEFLKRTEWAVTAKDILERRTKHMLHISAAERQDFERWMEAA
jgi:glycerol-3-phosphate dehydrogenase